MEYIRFGTTGLKVSRLCLGMMTYGTSAWRPWVLGQPGVTAPIVGASRLSQLDEAVEAVALRLTPDERRSLEELYVPHQTLGIDDAPPVRPLSARA